MVGRKVADAIHKDNRNAVAIQIDSQRAGESRQRIIFGLPFNQDYGAGKEHVAAVFLQITLHLHERVGCQPVKAWLYDTTANMITIEHDDIVEWGAVDKLTRVSGEEHLLIHCDFFQQVE